MPVLARAGIGRRGSNVPADAASFLPSQSRAPARYATFTTPPPSPRTCPVRRCAHADARLTPSAQIDKSHPIHVRNDNAKKRRKVRALLSTTPAQMQSHTIISSCVALLAACSRWFMIDGPDT